MRVGTLGLLLVASSLYAQTTQALVTGRVVDAITGAAISQANVQYERLGTGIEREAAVGPMGVYVLPLLSPGLYRIRVDAGRDYQPREASRVQVSVSGLLQLDFELRPITDLWETGQYRSIFPSENRTTVNFYGPDVDFSRSGSFVPPATQESRLDGSISTFVSPIEVAQLPFAGRDVYTAIILQPLVTSGTTTARGLGISASGQRFGSGSYFLDGVDNNAYLVTGPQLITPIESLQEYRISIANYSAEYGGTLGFFANAITKTGQSGWHGLGYFYLMNDALDANDVSARYSGLPKSPYKQLEAGVQAGGALVPQRLFGFISFDRLRSRGYSPCEALVVPGPDAAAAAKGAAETLLSQYHPVGDSGCTPQFTPNVICPLCALTRVRPTESVNRTAGLARLDYVAGSDLRFLARFAASDLERPDYSYSPYPAFTSGLDQRALSTVLGMEYTRGRSATETRIGFEPDRLQFERAQPTMPSLQTDDGVALPTSGLQAGFAQKERRFNASYSTLFTLPRNFLKIGAGALYRKMDSALDAGAGTVTFANLQSFLDSAPENYQLNISRAGAAAGAIALTDPSRTYENLWAYGFAQDSWRVTSRLVLSGGYRLEYQLPPANVGPAKDNLVYLPDLATPSDRVNAGVWALPGGGAQAIYRVPRWIGAVRTGLAYGFRDGRTVLRAGFGTFHDNLFDNLWLNVQENQYESASAGLSNQPGIDYYQPAAVLLHSLFSPASGAYSLSPSPDLYHVIVFDPNLRLPSVKSGFLALEHTISRNWRLDAMAIKSAGSDLLTNDEVNRKRQSVRPNSNLPVVFYRSSSGRSNYRAAAARVRYQSGALTLQGSYTLSSSFDNQSDPLAGDFDLLRTQTQQAVGVAGDATFTQEFSPQYDYGHSDFDQRHNFVFYAVWTPPAFLAASRFSALTRGWSAAAISAIRSGTPFSVFAEVPSAFGTPLLNNRANLVCASGYQMNQPLPDGRLLLNQDCFKTPSTGQMGTTSRNQFYGPGAWNLDFSLSRTFHPALLPESGRLTLRAEAYNLFNHANLGNPASNLICTAEFASQGLCAPAFGQAFYGRVETGSYFPAVKPFAETGRQLQLMLRLEF